MKFEMPFKCPLVFSSFILSPLTINKSHGVAEGFGTREVGAMTHPTNTSKKRACPMVLIFDSWDTK